ncbi:hypothetical protein KKB44_02675 [Candidatus Micrarchaeota archaeon]|nr:hypothetical protein [Candidatus Micrarchaeota archaeon]
MIKKRGTTKKVKKITSKRSNKKVKAKDKKKVKVIKKAPKKEEIKVAITKPKLKEEEIKMRQRISTILSDALVRQTLIEIGGENALAIVRNFHSNHSDEELAKRLKIKISDVRATLNKLHNEGLVNYLREKDSETGWYSYSWSLNQERMEKWADAQSNKLISLCGSNEGEHYFCPACGMSTIIGFEAASNWEFRCEQCNRLLEYIDEKRMNELIEKTRV